MLVLRTLTQEQAKVVGLANMDIHNSVKSVAQSPQRESVKLLNCLVQQNEDVLNQNAQLIELQTQTLLTLKSINERQAKSDKINFPFIATGTAFAYSGVHIALYGVEDFKHKLIWLFDMTAGWFI